MARVVMENVFKGGRCWNGSQRDSGRIVHVIIGEEPNGFWGGKALCGSKPGSRGYGWSKAIEEPNCKKCIRKKEAKL